MRHTSIQQDMEWLCQHPEIAQQYRGQHVAIVDETVVASGEDFEKVCELAEAFDADPLFAFMPEEEVLIL